MPWPWRSPRRASASSSCGRTRSLTCCAPHPLVPGGAALLAFAAWQAGDGALAWCGIDRALEIDPDCSLAQLVADVLSGAVPPEMWQPPGDADLPVLGTDRAS